MAAGAEEAEALISHREDRLVAVSVCIKAGQDLLRHDALSPDMLQGGIDPIQLEAQLLPIAHVAGIASAASAVIGAVRRDPLRALLSTAQRFGVHRSRRRRLQDQRLPALSRNGARNKNGAPACVGDPNAFRAVALDLKVQYLVFSDFIHVHGCILA